MIVGVTIPRFDAATMFKSPEPSSQMALGHLLITVMLLVTLLASGAIVAVSFLPQTSVPIMVYTPPVASAGNRSCVVVVTVSVCTSESLGLNTSNVNGLFPFTNDTPTLASPMVQDFEVDNVIS